MKQVPGLANRIRIAAQKKYPERALSIGMLPDQEVWERGPRAIIDMLASEYPAGDPDWATWKAYEAKMREALTRRDERLWIEAL